MNRCHVKEIHRINYLNTEMSALYHQSSLKLGITDCVSAALYSIYGQSPFSAAEKPALGLIVTISAGMTNIVLAAAAKSLPAESVAAQRLAGGNRVPVQKFGPSSQRRKEHGLKPHEDAPHDSVR